jgi:hypothetical protein
MDLWTLEDKGIIFLKLWEHLTERHITEYRNALPGVYFKNGGIFLFNYLLIP